MKKIVLFSIIAVLLITGCGNKKTANEPVAETIEEEIIPVEADMVIGDKLFIGQVNDVYRNGKDYMGKTIKLEGIFMTGEAGGREYCYVYRKGPGCCGDDGQIGFEVSWNPLDSTNPQEQASEGEKKAYPKRNDWVEAQGELKRYSQDGRNFLYIALSYLEVMDERGVEFVTQ